MVDGIAGGSKANIDALRARASQRISTVAKPAPIRLAPDAGPDILVVGAATTLVKAGPPVDAEKVSKIKAAIAEGRYPVDAKTIAQKMIDLDLGPLK